MGGYAERPKIIVNDDNLIDSLIQWEGFLPRPTDIGDGKITLGSGLTDPKWVKLYKQRGNVWSKEDNRMAVAEEVAKRRDWAQKNVPNWELMHPESQKALLSYKYNYDFNRANSPKLFKALENKNWEEAARQMDATSKDPKFKKGLEDRRRKEQNWHRKGVRLQQEEMQNAQRTEAIPNRSFGEGIREFLMSPFKREPKSGSWADGGKLPAEEKVMRYFIDKGLARHQAAGLVGNLVRESQLDPQAVNKYSGAYGIAQWLGDRKKKLFSKYGSRPTLDQQLDFVWEELNSSHQSGLRHLLNSKNAEEAARMGMGYYEFQAGPEGAIAAMNKWGQDGEGSMRKGIDNALRLMGSQGLSGEARRNEIYGKYGNYEQTPVFMPRNPEAFFAPLTTYARPMEMREPEQPLVDMAALQARAEREAQREQRQWGLELLMGLMGSNGNGLGSLLGLIGKQ